MGTPDILSYKLAEGDWDDSLVNDEQIIHELAAGTRLMNLSLLRIVRRWNPLFVAYGYTYVSIDEGWRYSPSRKNNVWPVLQHMAMRPQDCYASTGPQTLKYILVLYKQGLTTRKLNFTRVQEILHTQLATYGEKFFDHSEFTYTDPATIYNLRATPVPADYTKRCEFCNDKGHLEEGCFHCDPLQLILNPPEIGYPDGKLLNAHLIKHQTP
jgi:hypothetical protein